MDTSPEPPLRAVPAAEARALLLEQQSTDLSIAAFARSRGVKPWSLYNVRAAGLRKARQVDHTDLIEVRPRRGVEDPPESPTKPLELVLPSGIALRIGRDFDEVTLRRLLGVLGAC